MRQPNQFLIGALVKREELELAGIKPIDDGEPDQLVVCASGAGYPNIDPHGVIFMAPPKGPHTRAEMLGLVGWLVLMFGIEHQEIEHVISGIVEDRDEFAKSATGTLEGQCTITDRDGRCELVAGHDGSHAKRVAGGWIRVNP